MAAIKKKFKFKSFTSFTLLFLLIILVISGTVLYIRPEGSVSRWVGWSFIGLEKKGWESLHTLLSIFFILFICLHLFFNLRILTSYLKDKLSTGMSSKKEFFSSVTLVILLIIISVMSWPPFLKISQWRSALKKGDYLISIHPPEADFEKKKLSEVASVLNLSLEELLHKIEQLNLVVDDPQTATLLKIAQSNKKTPENIFKLLTQ